MVGYPKLSKIKLQLLLGRTKRYLEEGKPLEEIAEIIKQPLGRVQEFADIIKQAEENRKKKSND